MGYTITTLLAGLMLASLCAAQERHAGAVGPENGAIMGGTSLESIQSEADSQESGNRIESWYLHFALGYGKPYYPEPLQQAVDQLSSMSGVSHVSMSLEVPGVYWSLDNNHTMIGGALSGIADRYEVSGNSVQINAYLISFSAVHFPVKQIGEGVFLRGDVGLSWMSVESSPGGSSSSDPGLGILLGGGYSIPVSNETRITLNMNYGLRWVESETYGALSINVGVLL